MRRDIVDTASVAAPPLVRGAQAGEAPAGARESEGGCAAAPSGLEPIVLAPGSDRPGPGSEDRPPSRGPATSAVPSIAGALDGSQGPPTLSALELHEFLLRTFRLGNRLRVKFILGLLALEESGQFKDLGYPTVWLYSEVFFKQRRSETFEMLRVARALRTLPLCRRAFETAAFSWSVLRAITRIAKPHTELQWIEFADKKSPEAIEAEVTDAVDKNRDLPRGRRYGLPGLKKSLTFRVTPTQAEVLEKALRKVAGEMRGRLSGNDVSPQEALLFLAERVLATDPPLADRAERDGSIYDILHQRCPCCRGTWVITDEGPVEVEPEVVERLRGSARETTIEPDERHLPVRGEAVPPSDADLVLVDEAETAGGDETRRDGKAEEPSDTGTPAVGPEPAAPEVDPREERVPGEPEARETSEAPTDREAPSEPEPARHGGAEGTPAPTRGASGPEPATAEADAPASATTEFPAEETSEVDPREERVPVEPEAREAPEAPTDRVGPSEPEPAPQGGAEGTPAPTRGASGPEPATAEAIAPASATTASPAEEMPGAAAPTSDPGAGAPVETAATGTEGVAPPTPASMRRRIFLRDHRRCANPGCRAKLGLQGHHIIFRALGGETSPWNECAVCGTCHALVHAGLLEVVRLPTGELRWTPKVRRPPLELLADEAAVASEPTVVVRPAPEGSAAFGRDGSRFGGTEAAPGLDPGREATGGGGPARARPESSESTAVDDSRKSRLEAMLRDVVCTLRSLGYAKVDAEARVDRAMDELAGLGRLPTIEELLQTALARRAA